MRASEQIIITDLGRAGGPSLAGLPVYSAAQTLRAAGTRNAKILVIGDSASAGWGGTNLATQINANAFAWPTVLAGLVPQGSSSSIFGDRNTLVGSPGTISLATFYNQITLGSWTQTVYPASSSTTTTIGGNMLRCAAGTTPLTFTPSNQVDTFEIYYATTGVAATSMTAQIDALTGPSQLTIDQSPAASLQKATVTAALGTHTLNLARVSGTVFVIGIVAYNSAQKETTVINGGFSGSKIGDWLLTNGVFDPIQVIPFIKPDLVLLMLTSNDWVAGTNTSTYTTNMQAMITACKNAGADVIMFSGPASQTTSAPQATQDIYTAIVRNLAAANGLRFVSMTTQLGDWATNNSLGREYDALHPNGNYYSLEAAQVNTIMANPGTAGTTYTKTVYLSTTGIGSWTVPSDFVSLSSVSTFAAGGGNTGGQAAAGAGAYASSPGSLLAPLTASWVPGTTTVPIIVGAGGNQANGQETAFGATSLAAAVALGSTLAVASDFGRTNVTTTFGAGGLAANSLGATTFNGGSGGVSGAGSNGGGGGAGGPLGKGADGGPGKATSGGGGGGGGNGGGTTPAVSTNNTGANGGDNAGGVGHGTGGGSAGTAGTLGAGGGGAGTGGGLGGVGGTDINYGGGGGGAAIANSGPGGGGGFPGGGAGGRGFGVGGNGEIVIKYNVTIT